MFYRPIDPELSLSLLTPNYGKELFQLTVKNRPFLRQWLPWVDAIQEQRNTENYISLGMKKFSEGEQIPCVILYRKKLVGCIGFNKLIPNTQVGWIGYWLAEEFNGRGIMNRAVREMEKIGFSERELTKIEIHCATGNIRSRNIPLRLGYTEEGLIRRAENLYGKLVNHHIYGLLKEDYLKRS